MNYSAVMSRFPPIQLPKETTGSGPVLYLAQPAGKRVFVWFTYHNTKNICFVVETHPAAIYPVCAAFASSLALGTVLQGTLFHFQNRRCFLMDDIFYYEGLRLEMAPKEKWELLRRMLGVKVDGCIHLPTQLMFALPDHSWATPHFDAGYKVQQVRCVSDSGVAHIHPQTKTAVFRVKPTETADIYELHNVQGFQGHARVESYDRSVLLNSLLKRRAGDLDLIEDSDDEDGEWVERDMVCKWDAAFKQWVPQHLST